MKQEAIANHPSLEHVCEHPQLEFFNKYRSDCNVFLETGTAEGFSVYRALVLGFEKILSIDCEKKFVDSAMQEYADEVNAGQVFLYEGFSGERLSEMCENIEESDRCFFWLDAHTMDGAHTVSTENEVPIFKELEIIRELGRKNDIIMIDDVALFYRDKLEPLVEMLHSINPEYKLMFDDMHNRGPYVLIATTEDV
jgi:hypothetical protein|tara:strand:- start:11 stop:598 length:588 start_codon:yes stop_codon:yes gene_type:complete